MNKAERTAAFTIACRYVPYDQWFVTHAHPSWKVKHLKESIVAKALNLPFDRRLLEVDVPVNRPPSPITFAPDETERPISPIKFARRPVTQKKSRATLSLDSSTDRDVAAEKEKGEASGLEGDVAAKPEETRASEGTVVPTAEEDDDDDQIDAISFESGDGYEEDDESDDGLHPLARTRTPTGGKVFVPPIKMPTPLGSTLSALSPSQPSGLTSIHIHPRHGAPISLPGGLVRPQRAARDKEQIYTAAFTLIRYSTGQVLEDDFNVGWYHFMPNELVEIHASSPPLSFLVSAFLSDTLTNGGSHSIQGLVTALASGHSASSGAANATALSLSKVGFSMAPGPGSNTASGAGSAANHGQTSSIISSFMNGEVPGVSYQSSDPPSSSNPPKVLTVSLPLGYPPILTSLPRQDAQAYIQPYWEGWVRVLRVVYRPEVDAMMQYSLGGSHGSGGGNHAAFMALGGHQFDALSDLNRKHDHGDGYATSKRRTKMEWRDRWVVIREGTVFLCKDREDSEPTHRLPLSSLTNLRGADHLANNVRQRDKPGSGKSRETAKDKDAEKNASTLQPGGTSTRPTSSRSAAAAGSQPAATAFANNPVLSGGSPRRSTSISATSSSTPRASPRRGTVSGATTLDSTGEHGLAPAPPPFSSSTPSTVSSTSQTKLPAGPNLASKEAFQSAETSTSLATPRPGPSNPATKSSLSPLILPTTSTLKTSNLVSASAPISPVTPPLSPAVANKYLNSSSTNVTASSSKSIATSPASSSASTLLAENSSARRAGRSPSSSHRSDRKTEDKSRHHPAKHPKDPRSKTVSLERDQKTPEQREKERKRRLRERELAKEAAADLEYIQKWDDLGFSFGKKSKDKEKGKVDKGKEKEKEKKAIKLPEVGLSSKDREKAKEKEKRRAERELELDMQRQQTIAMMGVGAAANGLMPNSVLPPAPVPSNADTSSHGRSFSYSTIRQRNQASLQHPPKGLHFFDKTYIPGSNEEAENIGMRIVCAKFRVDNVNKTSEKDPARVATSSTKARSLNTLADGTGQADDDSGYGHLWRGDKEKEKEKRRKLEKEKKGKEKAKPEEELPDERSKKTSSHILNLADTSISLGFPPRKASLPGLSLSFGSGKDKEKEKEKWAERSFEKAEKKRQKDLTKKKDRDDSGEDAPGISSWKLGKKRKQAVDSDTEKDKSTTATEDDDGQTDDGVSFNGSASRSRVRVQVHVETTELGDSPQRPRLTVSTATMPKLAPTDDEDDDNVNLSSPVFAHSTDSDDSEGEFGFDRRRGYRYGGYHEEKLMKQQHRQPETEVDHEKTITAPEKTSPKPPPKKRDDEKYEWIVLDMGSLAAYNSILRIFHRHFKPPMQSVFINSSAGMRGDHDEPHYLSQDDDSFEDHTFDKTIASMSHHPSALKQRRRRPRAATLALPYPEWRNQIVSRARSQGMLETGRPTEFVMDGWDRGYELMTQEFRRQKKRDSDWRRKFRQGYGQNEQAGDRKASVTTIKVDKGKQRALDRLEDSLSTVPSDVEEVALDKEQDDYDASLTADPILLEDSEEESEEEFARWWRDVPRQIEAEEERHLREMERELLDDGDDSTGDYHDDPSPERRTFASSSYSLDRMPSISSNVGGPPSTSTRQPPPIFIKTSGLSALHADQQAAAVSPTTATPTPSTLRSPDTLLSSTSTQVPVFGSPVLSSAHPDGLRNFHSLPSLTALSEDTAVSSFASQAVPPSRFHGMPPSKSPQQERDKQSRFIRNLEPSAGASAKANEKRGENSSSVDLESAKHHGENRLSKQSLAFPTDGYQFPSPKDDLQSGLFHPRSSSDSSSAQSHLSYEESTISGHSHTRPGSLHHSVSFPSSSSTLNQAPFSPPRTLAGPGPDPYRSSGSSTITSSLFGSPLARERTMTLPTNFGLSMAEMAIALGQSSPTYNSQRSISQVLPGARSVGGGDDSLEKPILTPEQIRQIENETFNAWVPPREDETRESMVGLTITPTRLTPPMSFGSSSPPGSVGRSIGKRFHLRGVAGIRTPTRTGHASGSDDERGGENTDGVARKRGLDENASPGVGHDERFKNGTRPMFRTASNPTSPATATIAPDLPWKSSIPSSSTSSSSRTSSRVNQADSQSQSAHAKDILRRVRSGSSLHLMPMGVHLELEENIEGDAHPSGSNMDDDSQDEENGDAQEHSIGRDGSWPPRNNKWNPSDRRGEPTTPNDGDRDRKSAMFKVAGYGYASANGHGFIG